MPGLVRFSTLLQPISKYWTTRLVSRYFALGCEFRDSDQARRGRIAEQHRPSIRLLFAYCQG